MSNLHTLANTQSGAGAAAKNNSSISTITLNRKRPAQTTTEDLQVQANEDAAILRTAEQISWGTCVKYLANTNKPIQTILPPLFDEKQSIGYSWLNFYNSTGSVFGSKSLPQLGKGNEIKICLVDFIRESYRIKPDEEKNPEVETKKKYIIGVLNYIGMLNKESVYFMESPFRFQTLNPTTLSNTSKLLLEVVQRIPFYDPNNKAFKGVYQQKAYQDFSLHPGNLNGNTQKLTLKDLQHRIWTGLTSNISLILVDTAKETAGANGMAIDLDSPFAFDNIFHLMVNFHNKESISCKMNESDLRMTMILDVNKVVWQEHQEKEFTKQISKWINKMKPITIPNSIIQQLPTYHNPERYTNVELSFLIQADTLAYKKSEWSDLLAIGNSFNPYNFAYNGIKAGSGWLLTKYGPFYLGKTIALLSPTFGFALKGILSNIMPAALVGLPFFTLYYIYQNRGIKAYGYILQHWIKYWQEQNKTTRNIKSRIQ